MIGGGSLPEESLPTKLVALSGDGAQVTEVARRLRVGTTPVVGRIERDALLLDPRTVGPNRGPRARRGGQGGAERRLGHPAAFPISCFPRFPYNEARFG